MLVQASKQKLHSNVLNVREYAHVAAWKEKEKPSPDQEKIKKHNLAEDKLSQINDILDPFYSSVTKEEINQVEDILKKTEQKIPGNFNQILDQVQEVKENIDLVNQQVKAEDLFQTLQKENHSAADKFNEQAEIKLKDIPELKEEIDQPEIKDKIDNLQNKVIEDYNNKLKEVKHDKQVVDEELKNMNELKTLKGKIDSKLDNIKDTDGDKVNDKQEIRGKDGELHDSSKGDIVTDLQEKVGQLEEKLDPKRIENLEQQSKELEDKVSELQSKNKKVRKIVGKESRVKDLSQAR